MSHVPDKSVLIPALQSILDDPVFAERLAQVLATKLKVGDVVRLKSGGQPMTVTGFHRAARTGNMGNCIVNGTREIMSGGILVWPRWVGISQRWRLRQLRLTKP